jgi:hypothetical protein
VTGCHGPARVFNANEFKHIEILDDFASGKDEGDPRVECLYCQLQFVGQATRIRAHLSGRPGFGVEVPADVKQENTEVPADVKQENIRVTQEKTREQDAKGKKRKVADNIHSAVAAASNLCRIPACRTRKLCYRPQLVATALLHNW